MLFGYDGLFIKKQIDIMNLIPYELFEINPKTALKRLKKHYTNRKIKECSGFKPLSPFSVWFREPKTAAL